MRHMTPTALKLLRGPTSHSKSGPEPEPEQLKQCPEPPVFLEGYAYDEWCRVAPGVHAMGMLPGCDLAILAAYCAAFGRWRYAEEQLAEQGNGKPASAYVIEHGGRLIRNPVLNIAREASLDMLRHAQEFGLSPAARARIGATGNFKPAVTKSKFAGLTAGR